MHTQQTTHPLTHKQYLPKKHTVRLLQLYKHAKFSRKGWKMYSLFSQTGDTPIL